MHAVRGLLVVLSVQFPARADDDTVTKNDLLIAIRRDLRRNNDDYVGSFERNKSFPPGAARAGGGHTAFGNKIFSKTEVKTSSMNTNNRRANGGESWEFHYKGANDQNSTVPALKKSDHIANRFITVAATKRSVRMRSDGRATKVKLVHVRRNLSRLSDLNEIEPSNLKIISNDTPRSNPKFKQYAKSINKKKIDNFKRFVSKMRGEFETRTETTREGHERTIEVGELLKKSALRNVMKKSHRAGDRDEGGPPDPEALDMAPAKGGRIHRLRVKGRLCARHVLLPEGPKYDSNGRWYVPAHRLVARHRYDVTPRPRLLLPRCCNCCKKSALGCE